MKNYVTEFLLLTYYLHWVDPNNINSDKIIYNWCRLLTRTYPDVPWGLQYLKTFARSKPFVFEQIQIQKAFISKNNKGHWNVMKLSFFLATKRQNQRQESGNTQDWCY